MAYATWEDAGGFSESLKLCLEITRRFCGGPWMLGWAVMRAVDMALGWSAGWAPGLLLRTGSPVSSSVWKTTRFLLSASSEQQRGRTAWWASCAFVDL